MIKAAEKWGVISEVLSQSEATRWVASTGEWRKVRFYGISRAPIPVRSDWPIVEAARNDRCAQSTDGEARHGCHRPAVHCDVGVRIVGCLHADTIRVIARQRGPGK
jgi:hypothetical protein